MSHKDERREEMQRENKMRENETVSEREQCPKLDHIPYCVATSRLHSGREGRKQGNT